MAAVRVPVPEQAETRAAAAPGSALPLCPCRLRRTLPAAAAWRPARRRARTVAAARCGETRRRDVQATRWLSWIVLAPRAGCSSSKTQTVQGQVAVDDGVASNRAARSSPACAATARARARAAAVLRSPRRPDRPMRRCHRRAAGAGDRWRRRRLPRSSAPRRRQHRAAARHGLGDRPAEALGQAREQQQLGVAVERFQQIRPQAWKKRTLPAAGTCASAADTRASGGGLTIHSGNGEPPGPHRGAT